MEYLYILNESQSNRYWRLAIEDGVAHGKNMEVFMDIGLM